MSFEGRLGRLHFRVRRSLQGDLGSPLVLFDNRDAGGRQELVLGSSDGNL